jgi:hypothetical protein
MLMLNKVIIILMLWLSSLTVSHKVIAHHSFAMFDLSKHILIEGHVKDWHFNNPHSWLHIEGLDKNAELVTWSFEGASIVHAARQGVRGNTFKRGDFVRIIMSPMHNGRNAGVMCFVIKEDGSIVTPNDGICNAQEVIEEWKSAGRINSSNHLDEYETNF